MSDDKREQLRGRIEAAEARQQARERAEQAGADPDRMTSFAREHPLMVVAGGLAIGVALSALIPRSPTRRLSKKTIAFLGAVAEFGISYGREAMDAAEETAHQGKARLTELGSAAREKAEQARQQGKAKLAELRRSAKGETAETLEEAGDRLEEAADEIDEQPASVTE